MIGTTISHYRIIEHLGEGGMGVVYKAEDTSLARMVAIKVLPETVASDPDRLARLEREARSAGSLNHPNILTVHALGNHEGVPFIVTELLEGESLRDRIERHGPLGPESSREIGAAVAEGLAVAHGHGIVHRDIKPANVFITINGLVKILDFGLAKVESDSGTDDTHSPTATVGTHAGALMGTVGYMSPEQVRGKRADHRSDVFSLGCVLFEMVSGIRPFHKPTAAETMAAILHKAPADTTRAGATPSPELERIIARCLEKEPARRFQSASDLAFALRSLTRDSTQQTVALPASGNEEGAQQPPSVVVLPFANLSSDQGDDYFSDGLTEEIIADLAKIKGLRVISRTSSMRFKGATVDLRAVASELGVRYVVEGSVRKSGDDLRITAQLIDASTDTHLWAEKYSGTMADIFDLQEEVSRKIVEGLEVALTVDEDRRLGERPITDPRAYDTWLRAKQEALTLTPEGIARGRRLTESAIDLIGESALLQAMLGWFEIINYTYDPNPEGSLEAAQDYAEKSLELESNQPWALFVKGVVHHRRGEPQEFVRLAQRSIDIERNSHVLSSLAAYLGDVVGPTDAARRYAAEGLTLDPLSWLSVWARGYLGLLGGRFDEAFARLKEGADSFAPRDGWSMFCVGFAAAQAGRTREAETFFSKSVATPAPMWSDLSSVFLVALGGSKPSIYEGFLRGGQRFTPWRTGHSSQLAASGLAWCGEPDAALLWLEHAVEMGFWDYRYLGEVNPFFEGLRGLPRFEELVTRAREQQNGFEV